MNNEIRDKITDRIIDSPEESRIREEEARKLYPPDIPNERAYHAFIKGISLENSFGPVVGEYNFLFETQYEKVYVWTASKNKNSLMVSEVDTSVKEIEFWKTAGSLINLSLAYYHAFEGADFENILEYKFIYYFSQSDSLKDQKFADVSNLDLLFIRDGRHFKATDIADLAPMIELMNRDERCYTATALLLSSFQIHYCCLICELGLSPYRMHDSHEPEVWEQADSITSMEGGIVQACRCAELILGEPPNRKKQSRILAHKLRWRDLIGIEPDEMFERAEMSYWDFYLRMFDELRNPSAHSYGKVHFELKRKHAIDVQCFAALILRGYVDKNKVQFDIALDSLHFNRELLDRVKEYSSTPLTKEM